MKRSKVIQFGVQINYFRKEADDERPVIMVINPNGVVLDIVSDFACVADVLSSLAGIAEENSVNTDN